MDSQIVKLLDAVRQAGCSSPDDIPAFLESLPDAGTLPSPWETWTLFGFIRHRERQYWVRDIIQNKLSGNSSAIAAMGNMGHPEGVPPSGSVPTMPEWEYEFHGQGCCLTHKVTGESIDVDFWDETAEYFDLYFYTTFLKSLRQPELVDQRLLHLHCSVDPVRISADHLRAAGAMIAMPGRDSHPIRLADEVLAEEDAIKAICSAWADPANRIWLAGLIGDWLAADEAAAGNLAIQQITKPRADKCRALRRQRLQAVKGFAACDALFGLAELGDAEVELKAALNNPPSAVTTAALQIICQQDDPKWCPYVYSMFKQLSPTREIPEPYLWVSSLELLLRHDCHSEQMIAALPDAAGSIVGEAVLLALEYAPQHALPLIRRGLLSDIPCNRTTAAAILALIAKPWSKRELLRALEVSDDQERTSDARAALLETGDAEAEKAVLTWEEMNPHEAEPGHYIESDGRMVGPFYSMNEIVLKNRASFIKHAMNDLHDRVMKVKHIVPPEL
jgi:hypothetical protein